MSNEIQKPAEGVEIATTASKEQAAIHIDPKQISGIVEAIAVSGIAGSVGYNEIASMPYVRGTLPWDDSGKVRPWNDADDSYLLAYLQTKYGVKNEKAVQHALIIACDMRRFNPVIDIINTLPKWDGVKRVGYLFHAFLGADNNTYTQAVERLFLSALIMRTFHPGAKFDYMLVLTGPQGIGKSTLAKLLALDDEFFTDSLTGIGKKEGAELVQGNLVVEVAELDAIKGKDLETVKAFISRTSDDFRPPYAKRVKKHLRRFALMGTTNSRYFLRDASGRRRFLPVECGVHEPTGNLFDDKISNIVRQAWAEMLHEYKQLGSLPLVLPDEVQVDAAQKQEAVSIEDVRIGEIEVWLDSRSPNEKVCISQICELALEIPRHQQKPWQQNEVREIMARHFPEWKELEKKQRVTGYGTQRVYQKDILTNPS